MTDLSRLSDVIIFVNFSGGFQATSYYLEQASAS